MFWPLDVVENASVMVGVGGGKYFFGDEYGGRFFIGEPMRKAHEYITVKVEKKSNTYVLRI